MVGMMRMLSWYDQASKKSRDEHSKKLDLTTAIGQLDAVF